MRLDKAVTAAGLTRSEAKKAISAGRVKVGDQIIRNADFSVGDETVFIDNMPVGQKGFTYIMLNKPSGVLTATRDLSQETVLDLVPESMRVKDLGPVGRLDKDVTGLIILTDDGQLAHRLISPKRNVKKVYIADVSGEPDENELDIIRKGGIVFTDFTSKPAEAEKIDASTIKLTLTEGKFHEVKRVCLKIGHEVLKLKRVSMGGVPLDEKLEIGECRYLTENEVAALYLAAGMEKQ